MLIAIAIIGILAGGLMLLMNPSTQIQKANDAKRKSDLKQIQNVLETYYNDNGRYPVKSADNEIAGHAWGTSWVGYMGELPDDVNSSKSYAYNVGSDGQTYYLYASLDRVDDSQACPGGTCASLGGVNACAGGCNYGVSSPDVSVSESAPVGFPTAYPVAAPTPTSKPAQTPLKTNYAVETFKGPNSWHWTMGYRFKSYVNGKITALWDFSYEGTTKTLTLWSDTNAVLNSVTVTGGNGSWVQGSLATPTSITAGTYYKVTTHINTKGYYMWPLYTPVTLGDIVIASTTWGSGDNPPTSVSTSYMYGLSDITFIPD
ncbi:MAG: DUF4082 domain-containing protein [Candidatus Daviesbacteria bacterium]|nr:DUF4082 domain-containing protein [Candidatus Daviesbacteria bacterium]